MRTLQNIGNSCYMNAALYALRFTPTFLHNLHHIVNIARQHQEIEITAISEQQEGGIDVINKLHDVFVCLASSGQNFDGAKRESNELQKSICEINDTFIPNTQQDSHELLMFLLNCMRDASVAFTNLDIFERIKNQASELCFENFRKTFIGQRSSTTRCLCCETQLSQVEEMIDLFVALPTGTELKQNFIRDLCVTKERFEEKIKCPECIRFCQATVTTSFPELPRILIVHIGRFDSEAKKVNTVAPILYQLDCFCCMCDGQPEDAKKNDHQYRLYAIIVHVGKTPKSGHYMAYVRSSRRIVEEEDEGEEHDCQFNECCNLGQTERIDEADWYICNDDIITEMSQPDFETMVKKEAKRKTPSVLLYARNDVVGAYQ